MSTEPAKAAVATAATKQVKEIVAQIEKTRDVDSETSKPRLLHKKTPPAEDNKPDSEKKPSSAKSLEMHKIFEPFLNYPMHAVRQPTISTFIPSAYNMYHIIHTMDEAMRKNTFFRKQEDAWHPLISRLYFGFAFIIQAVRAEVESGHASNSRKLFYETFTRTYPLEDFPIPGPLVSLFKALNPARSESTLDGIITPIIPDEVGPAQTRQLINYDDDHCHQLILPNIPLLIGFIGTITSAQPALVPNYSVAATFDNTADRNLNGYLFTHEAWTNTARAALMTPGLLYPVETDNELDTKFNLYGNRIGIPPTVGNQDLRPIQNFLHVDQNDTWFGKVTAIMTTYCEYFRGSTTLATCSSTTTVAPLITSIYPNPTAQTFALSPMTTLARAFPPSGPFSLTTIHTTFEREIPPASAMLAQCASLNVTFSPQGYGPWNHIGNQDVTRTGPYWQKSPLRANTLVEDTYKGTATLIKRHYLLTKPIEK